VHSGDRCAEEVEKQVHVMATVAKKLAAAQLLRVGDPRVLGNLRVLLGPEGDVERNPIFTRLQDLPQLQYEGMEAHTVADHENGSRRFRGFDELQALFLRVRQRLLHEHVLTSSQELHPHRVMEVVRQSKDGRITPIRGLPVIVRPGVGAKLLCRPPSSLLNGVHRH